MAALVGETVAEDELPKNETLEEHDKKRHGGHFDPSKGTCKFRDQMVTETEKDKADIESPDAAPKRDGTNTGASKRPIVTSEEDAAYMEAVEKGDMETAAKMVREVAAKAFPNTKVVDEDGKPKVVYHGGNFRRDGEHIPDLEPGEMHFGTKKAAEERIAYKYQGMEEAAQIKPYFLNLENPKRMEDIGGDSIWLDWGNPEDRKYDGVVYKNEGEDIGKDSYAVSWDANRIKSAAPVEYDDDGNIIPLSKRFNPKSRDVRYSKSTTKTSIAPEERKRLESVAAKVKNFIKGVTIKFSNEPYRNTEPDARKSIKESEQANWNRILDAFENKTAGADATFHHQLLDHTPAVYQRLGVKNLPITIMGGVIHKMIGNIRNSEYDYHDIPISELRHLLIDLDNPVAVFQSASDPDALVVLTNILDRHGNLKSVVPLKLDREASGTAKENVIASAYGQKPKNLQEWIDTGLLLYVSKKALRKSAQRLQLPRDSILKTRGVLMEDDFTSEQLGEIIPNFSSADKGGNQKNEESKDIINFRDSQGKVVGIYNRKTNDVVLYEGADADTIGHELCGHATWQYAEQQAAKGDRKLLERMQEVVDAPSAKPVWDEVEANYEGEDHDVKREEVWAHIIGHETSKAIEEIQKSRSGRRWYQKAWNVVKDAWKGLLSTLRINSVHLEGTEEMSPKEFSEYIVKQMLEGRTLGELEKGGDEGERKSIIGEKGAKQLKINTVAQAKKMAKRGASREQIFDETGWWKGKDGKWRIEIPDLQLKKQTMDTLKKDHFLTGAKLEDVIEAPQLFKAYPKLREVEVNFKSMPSRYNYNEWGHYDSGMKRINLFKVKPDKADQIVSRLTHEVQHAIQDEEGLPTGTDVTDWESYRNSMGEVEARNAQKRLSSRQKKRYPWETEDVPEEKQVVSKKKRRSSGVEEKTTLEDSYIKSARKMPNLQFGI